MWHKEETCCSQESNTDSADKFSSEKDSPKTSHNHLGPVGGSCLLGRIALTFWEGECLKKLNKTMCAWRRENLVIFVFAHKILMAAGKKLACTNVLSGTQNNEHTWLKKMHFKVKKRVIFTVLFFFELFVCFLLFSILPYKLLKLQNYYSSLNFVGNLSLRSYSASTASFLINAQLLYSPHFPSSFTVFIQMSLGSLSSSLFHIHVSHRTAFILQAPVLYLKRQQCL